jgi:hypothetical protein
MLVTACSGVLTPITRRDTPDDGRIARQFSDPESATYGQIAEWQDAIQNIQSANSAGILSISTLAALVGYRSARGESSAATAALAGTGLLGMSVSETFIQVQRIKVYAEGVHALECALNAYHAVIPPKLAPRDSRTQAKDSGTQNGHAQAGETSPTGRQTRLSSVLQTIKDSKVAILDVKQWAEETERRSRAVDDSMRVELDPALAGALSDIRHQVDSVLLGTVLSVQSRSPAWTSAMTPALQAGATSPSQSDAATKILRSAGLEPAVRVAIERLLVEENERAARVAILDAAKASLAKCSITTTTVAPETIPVALGIDRLGEADPIAKPPGKVVVRVYGGSGQYSAAVVGTTDVTTSQSVSDGQALLTIDTSKAKSGTTVLVVVSDRLRSSVSSRVTIKVT